MLQREMLSSLRDHGGSLQLQQCCLTSWLVPPLGRWQSLCPGRRFRSPQGALIWAVCFALLPRLFPPRPSHSPDAWMEDFLAMLVKRLGGRWFVADTRQCGHHRAGQRLHPHRWDLCSETTPCHWAVPPGYSLFQALCWVAAEATFSISSLPGRPVYCSFALPVIPMTFFESFHFPAATFSCQLVNMVIIQGAHIKAKLSWYSSFHMRLSPRIPQSSNFSPIPFISPASDTATLFVLSALTYAISDTACCHAHDRVGRFLFDCWGIKYVHLQQCTKSVTTLATLSSLGKSKLSYGGETSYHISWRKGLN